MQNNPKRIKVVWLCHLCNNQLKLFFNRPEINEFAPWMSIMIDLFKNREDIELHIVSPNVFNNKNVLAKIDGVNYYFYKHTILIRNVFSNKYIFKYEKILNKICRKFNIENKYIKRALLINFNYFCTHE